MICFRNRTLFFLWSHGVYSYLSKNVCDNTQYQYDFACGNTFALDYSLMFPARIPVHDNLLTGEGSLCDKRGMWQQCPAEYTGREWKCTLQSSNGDASILQVYANLIMFSCRMAPIYRRMEMEGNGTPICNTYVPDGIIRYTGTLLWTKYVPGTAVSIPVIHAAIDAPFLCHWRKAWTSHKRGQWGTTWIRNPTINTGAIS